MQANITKDQSYKALIIWFVAIAAYTIHSYSSFSLYQWPEMDNFPFFLRNSTPNLLNDNFIINSVQDGPRNIFQYSVTLISSLWSNNWKLTLIVINFFSLAIFPLLYLSVVKFCEDFFKTHNKNIAFLICLSWTILYYTLEPYTQTEIAGWRMVINGFTAYSFSLFITLTGYLSPNKYIKIILLFYGCLLHPTTGGLFLLLIIAFSLLHKKRDSFQYILIFISSYLLLFLLFNSNSNLSTKEFIDIYITFRHPHHYLISDYLSSGREIKRLIIALAIILIAWLYKRDFNYIAFIIILAISLLMSYLFIMVIPIKVIAAIGPNRFFYFYPFLAGVTLSTSIPFKFNFPTSKLKYISPILILGFSSIYFYRFSSQAFSESNKNLELQQTIERLGKGEILVDKKLPLKYMPQTILCQYHGNVYSSEIFPFNEKYFKEFKERYEFLKNFDYNNIDVQTLKNRNISYILTKKDLKHNGLLLTPLNDGLNIYKVE